MIVTQRVNALCAQLQLRAVALSTGAVLRSDLQWQLIPQDRDNATPYESTEGKPLFQVPAGQYRLEVHYREQLAHTRPLKLTRNTLMDLTVLVGAMRPDDPMGAYHLAHDQEVDPYTEFKRREIVREGQLQHGRHASGMRTPAMPSMDNDINGPAGMMEAMGLGDKKPHPIIANAAQFQTTDPQEHPDPRDNLPSKELKKEMVNQHQPTFNPAPSPLAGG